MKMVLIVEDDRIYARTIANWLIKNGINAGYVLSGASAREFIAGCTSDLILSDYRLPDGNGVELLEWIKQNGYWIPFLVMTGYGEIAGAVEAIKRGAPDYLPKPVQTEKVLAALTGLLQQEQEKMYVDGWDYYQGKSPLTVKL